MDGKQKADILYDKEVFDEEYKEDARSFADFDERIEANRTYRMEEKPMDVSYEEQLEVIERIQEKSSDSQKPYLRAIWKTIHAQKELADLSKETYDVLYAYRNKT